MAPTLRLLAAILTLLLSLAGCGGGGESEAPPPELTTSTVGAEGGVLRVSELSLTLPPNALTAALPFSVGKVAAGAGEIARYELSPAGQVLKQRGEIRFERAGLPANARFFWEIDGELWMVPTTRSGDVLTATLRSIGLGAAGPAAAGTGARALAAPRPQATPPGSAKLVILAAECRSHATQLAGRMNQAMTSGDMERAVAIAEDIGATELACIEIDVQILEQRSCDVLAGAVSQADLFVAKDFEEFKSLTTPLIAAKAFVELTDATCTPVGPERVDALIEAKFNQFLDVLSSQQLRGEFVQDAGKAEFAALLDYKAQCDATGLTTTCARLSDKIFPDLLDAMRLTAFDECRRSGLNTPMAQLHALDAGSADAADFVGFGRFSRGTLEVDMAYCASPTLQLNVFDSSSGIADELADRAQTMRPTVAIGQYAIGSDIEVPRNAGSLTVAGNVAAPHCADGTLPPSELVVRINGREVARRGIGGREYTLVTSPLDLQVRRVMTDVGLDPDNASGFTLEFFREGAVCVDPGGDVFTAPFKMFEIRVDLGTLPPKVFVLKGAMNFRFDSTEVDDLGEAVKPRRKVTNVTVTGRVEESAGRAIGFLTTLNGTIVETHASLRSFDVLTEDGTHCTFEHVFDEENTTTLVASAASSLSVDLGLSSTELTVGEFTVRTPTKLTSKSTATLRNQAGDCRKVDTSAPPPTSDTFDSQISLNKLFSLKSSPAFRALVVTDSAGRRSVTLSGATSDSLPRNGNGLTISQSSSFVATLADAPK